MSLDYENWRGRVRVTRLLPHVWVVRCRSNPNTHHEADRATRVIIAAGFGVAYNPVRMAGK